MFRTTLNVGNKEIDDWFLDLIGDFNLNLKNDIIKTNTNLLKGKKYNTFYKIPILYSFIMQRLFNLKANQDIIENTISYFEQICNFIQKAIEIVVLDTSLLYGVDGSYLNISELFQIGNPEFDTNVSTQYFLQTIKNKYPNLIGAMSSYLGATNNIYTMAGLIPFSGYDQKYLIDFNVMFQETFNKNIEKYKNIYDTFSSTEFNSLIINFVKNSKISSVSQLRNKEIDEMILGLNIKLN